MGLPVRFTEFLTALRPGGRPGLYFLHLVLPHQPWRYFEDGQLYNTDELDPDFPVSRTNEAGGWVAALTEQRHLYQATYTDRLVGAMVEQLEEVGLYDDALVIVASDHGISFELDTVIREPVPSTLDSLAYSPLVVKYPGQHDGTVDDGNVMAVDVLPTIAAVVGLDVPQSVTGAPIGSEAQTGRGGAKYVLDVADDFGQQIRGRMEFDDADAFPDPTDRWIPPGAGPDALADLAGIADLVGQPLDSLDPVSGGDVTIDALEHHERPADVPEALVVGHVAEVEEGTIVVAVDGVIVAGSPLFEFNGSTGSFAAMLPRELITEPKTLRVALLDGDGAIELAVTR